MYIDDQKTLNPKFIPNAKNLSQELSPIHPHFEEIQGPFTRNPFFEIDSCQEYYPPILINNSPHQNTKTTVSKSES